MTARTYELGLIPCTRSKNPIGVTPLTLYRSSPFSTMMNHARQRCRRILIMSAKYGLLELDDRVAFYEAYLPTLDGFQLAKLKTDLKSKILAKRLLEIEPAQVLSYLPKAYYECLASIDVAETWAAGIHRPYKSLSLLTFMKVLSYETKGFESPGIARR